MKTITRMDTARLCLMLFWILQSSILSVLGILLSAKTKLAFDRNKQPSCLNLYYHDTNEGIPRCEHHKHNCWDKPPLDLKLSRFETKPGKRLVGDEDGDKFMCYPLSDEDIFNSRSAVKGNLRLIKSLHSRVASATNKDPIRVLTVGGSVTNGGGCQSYALKQSKRGTFGPCSWTNRFVNWMKKYYSNNHIELISLAQPATTSTWLLSQLHTVYQYNPDLVLVDYGINDAIIGGISEEVQMMHDDGTRAATERLIKGFYAYNEKRSQHGNPPAAMMYVAMHRVAQDEPLMDNRSYHFTDNVYYPVCSAYGIPVVSIRDAVWPELNDRSRLSVWETVSGAHPIWSGHQLTADLMSYAWVAAISDHTKYKEELFHSPLMFQSGENLDVCTKPLPKSWQGKSPVPVQTDLKHWTWDDHNGKVGWQYTAPGTSHRLAMTNQPLTTHNNDSVAPTYSDLFGKLVLPEIISFNMKFDVHSPGISVEHLRSYEGFGQVCMWITRKKVTNDRKELEKTAHEALYYAWHNYLMRKYCVTLITKSALAKERMRTKMQGRPKGREVCEKIVMGTWSDPTILEGTWEDKSTQIHVSARNFGVGFIYDRALELWRVESFNSPRMFFSGDHDIEDVMNRSAPASEIVEAQVHLVPVPWSFEGMTDLQPQDVPKYIPWNFDTQGVRKFKVMGLNSC